MNRLDQIITESINNFLLSEIDESAKDWWSLEAPAGQKYDPRGRKKKIKSVPQTPQVSQPTHQPVTAPSPQPQTPTVQPQQVTTVRRRRSKPKTVFDAVTTNQIGMVIKGEWWSNGLKMIASLNRNIERMYGVKNAKILRNYFGEETDFKADNDKHDLFIMFYNKYSELCELTKDVENMSKEGEVNKRYVISRLADFPKPLEELAVILDNMYGKAKGLNILAKQQKKKNNSFGSLFVVNDDIVLQNGSIIKKAIINGYSTSPGLNKLMIFDKGLIDSTREKLFNLASNIRYKWGDNLEHGLNYDGYNSNPGKTIRR